MKKKRTIILTQPKENKNGITICHGKGCLNSVNVNKVSMSGRVRTVGKVNKSGFVATNNIDAIEAINSNIDKVLAFLKEVCVY